GRIGRPPGVPRGTALARHAAREGADDRLGRGLDTSDERAIPLDQEIERMSGEQLANRLRRGPPSRKRPPGSQVAADPVMPLGIADFHDLRRLGLFGDDGRNPPPSWWAR
ncbi:MAG TPA: hypothetical protein VHE35_36435, partial [Kofleriaceae bacterium]|nr:hypothetical protein [Kofleriaceae bacterium]